MIKSPCGIQVVRTESLRFLLLKAVLIPITMKYFFLVLDSIVSDFPDTAQPFRINSGSGKANFRFSSNVDCLTWSPAVHGIEID